MLTIARNIPNLFSSYRLIAAPILLFIARQNNPKLFLTVLAVSLMTDAIDGFFARRFRLTSSTGAKLDSWADFVTFIALAIGAWWLWPEILEREIHFVITGITSFLLPVLLGLIKFKKLPCYHTWAAKIQAVFICSAIYILFLTDVTWPFHCGVILQCFVSIEEIVITICLKVPRCDVPSLWHLVHSPYRLSAQSTKDVAEKAEMELINLKNTNI